MISSPAEHDLLNVLTADHAFEFLDHVFRVTHADVVNSPLKPRLRPAADYRPVGLRT
jgi:hypothetical protein